MNSSNGSPSFGSLLSRTAALAAIFATALGFSLPAFASLGGNTGSIQADTAHMSAKVDVTGSDNYQVHQLQLPAGTVVSEYISPSGTVFAVTWHGPFMPDLQQILGSYFQQYSEALESQSRQYGHRPLNIQQRRDWRCRQADICAHTGAEYMCRLWCLRA